MGAGSGGARVRAIGRQVRSTDWGVEVVQRADYALVRILRPVPGKWLICPRGLRGAHTAAAFVRSPLRVQVVSSLDKRQRQVVAWANFEDRALELRSGVARVSALPPRPASWSRRQERLGAGCSDALKAKDVATMPAPTLATPTQWPLEMLTGKLPDDARARPYN